MHAPIKLSNNKKELRDFGLIMGVMITGVFGGLLPWLFSFTPSRWIFGVALVFAVLGLILPMSLKYVHYIWMRFGSIMGQINSKILLTIFFYLVLLPTGILMRLFRDPMRRKLNSKEKSYRIKRLTHLTSNMDNPY